MLKKGLLFFLFSCCISCSIYIRGVKSNISTVMTRDISLIKSYSDKTDICDISYTDTSKVILLNGKDFHDCIITKGKVVIYVWDGHCKGSYCYSLNAMQDYFRDKDIAFYILSEYYDYDLMNAKYNIDYPIIGIDPKYYNTDIVRIYIKRFFKDMEIERTNLNRILFLENGKYIKSVSAIEDIS